VDLGVHDSVVIEESKKLSVVHLKQHARNLASEIAMLPMSMKIKRIRSEHQKDDRIPAADYKC
jgi:hypothetical protein